MKDIKYVSHPAQKYSALQSCSPNVDQLFIHGTKPELLEDSFCGKRVGIVGTRNATLAGLNDTQRIAHVVSEHGCVVVSGMALGIDGAAHQGAIDAGGMTIAVLGSGVDVIYPVRHSRMSEKIREHGCVISEFDMGTRALAWHFPIRNRIIAALSDVLVVPEGTLKGGARITVDLALAMGKTVCALPGPRRNASSELCNSIIKDGAVCITDPADVLRELGIESDNVGWERTSSSIGELSASHRKVVETLAHKSLSAPDICGHLGLDISTSTRLLLELEKAGLIRKYRGLYQAT